MSRRARGIPIDLLRRGLLVALLVFVTVVVGLYVMGRMGRPTETRVTPDLEDHARGELVLSGKGFDYGLTQGDREVFHIRAGRLISDKQSNYELEEVELTMEQEDGSVYHLDSDLAVYNLETQAATFTGNVYFRGPKEIELVAEGLELREEGAILVSSSPVEFKFLGRYTGRADRLRITPGTNIFVLAGHVKVDTLPGDASPMSLRCHRFTFDRDAHLLRADGDVALSRGEDLLHARRLSVILTDDESQVQFIRARWNVRGKLFQPADDGQMNRVEMRGRELSVEFEIGTEDPLTAELTASQKRPANLTLVDDSGLARQIEAEYLIGSFVSGALRRAEAFDGVEIKEFLFFDYRTVFRTACGDQAVATISAAGELSEVDLDGAVNLYQDGVSGFGDQAHADMIAGEMELTGKPALLMRRGDELEASRIVYDQNAEEIVAEDAVRAVLTSGMEIDLATDSASRNQPIRIESEQLDWTATPSIVTFSGQVRAWQGENFLVTDELVGEEETSRVIANGRVKTVWRHEPGEVSEGQDLPPEPLEVTADAMTFDRTAGTLTYSGNVRAIQLQRTLRCQEIVLFLGEDEGFEQMICEGQTHLLDGESGNSVVGERAIYQPGGRTVRVEGSPVVLRDSQGAEIQGKVLIYDFETATALIESEPPDLSDNDQDR